MIELKMKILILVLLLFICIPKGLLRSMFSHLKLNLWKIYVPIDLQKLNVSNNLQTELQLLFFLQLNLNIHDVYQTNKKAWAKDKNPKSKWNEWKKQQDSINLIEWVNLSLALNSPNHYAKFTIWNNTTEQSFSKKCSVCLSKLSCIIVYACIDINKQIVIIANRIHFNANQVAVWFISFAYYISYTWSYAMHTLNVNNIGIISRELNFEFSDQSV